MKIAAIALVAATALAPRPASAQDVTEAALEGDWICEFSAALAPALDLERAMLLEPSGAYSATTRIEGVAGDRFLSATFDEAGSWRVEEALLKYTPASMSLVDFSSSPGLEDARARIEEKNALHIGREQTFRIADVTPTSFAMVSLDPDPALPRLPCARR